MGSAEVVKSLDDFKEEIAAIEREMPFHDRVSARTPYQLLKQTVARHGNRPASAFQLLSDPKSKAETLTWRELLGKVTQTANLFRSLGVGDDDTVAYLLPGMNEAVITVLAAMTAGKASPINPLLEPEIVGGILRQNNAKVLVALKSFPKVDLAEKAALAAELAPSVETIIEVDLLPHLSGLKKLVVPLLRPKVRTARKARVVDFHKAMAAQPKDRLIFEETEEDRICAFFHTGGTTGVPKIAQHRFSGALYNAWSNANFLFTKDDSVLCPLPLFHVMAVYPILLGCVMSGAQMVQLTPAGYRGEGVFENLWKLIERWKVSVLVTVPTAAAAKLAYPVNADISTLRIAVAGSAPFPENLFKRFQDTVGVKILEGYGMTEATCIVSSNPHDAKRKIGSVGLPAPYTKIMILECEEDGSLIRELPAGETGEICVIGPGVADGDVYTEREKNVGHFVKVGNEIYMRTGDLGYFDDEGYLFITGRAKDLIIRGGHNIDPGVIEEELISNEHVAFVGAIGQPDRKLGETPAAYVELTPGSKVTVEDLMAHAASTIKEKAAVPKYIEIVDELPKTAVGKVFKPDLRRSAVKRVFDAELTAADIDARVERVEDVSKRGLVAFLSGNATDEEITKVIGEFVPGWERA